MITFTELLIGSYFGLVAFGIVLFILGLLSFIYLENYYRRVE